MNVEQFLALNPTLVATCRGVPFYEDPNFGDERPLLAIFNNRIVRTDAWDCDDLENDSGLWED